MSIFRINENPKIDTNPTTRNIRIQNGSKKVYYPTAKLPILDTNFYRTQNNNTLLNLYKTHNSINTTQNIVDSNYADCVKIVFYTPPIEDSCGGVMVLHNIAKTINDLGYSNFKAYLYSYDHKTYNNKFCNNFYNPYLLDNNTIAVYPEIIYGNPLGAKNVVRWVLLDLGYEVPKNYYKYSWNRNDVVYHWEPSNLNNSKQLVNIWINPIIKRTNPIANRNKKCYGFKKVNYLPKIFHKKIQEYHDTKVDTNIDKLSIDMIVKTFNECDTFYCYDPNTFFTIMAPLCGCVTVLHPIEGVDRESYFRSRIICHKTSGFCYDAGIAYGNDPDEIDRARKTLPQAKQQFEQLNTLYRSTVMDFVYDMVNIINGKGLTNTVENIYYGNQIKKES